MSGDDFSGDAAQYAALQEEMSQPSSEDMWGAVPEELPLDDAEYQEGMRQANAQHPQYLQEQARARQQQAEAAQQQQQQQQSEDYRMNEDPIGYFQAKMQGMQNHLTQDRFVGVVERSERQAREQWSDYDEACEHLERGRLAELERAYPDAHPKAAQLARHYGFQNPAQLRAALLNRDRVHVAATALQRGQSPAELYYALARQRGWAGKPAINKAEAAHMTRLADENPEAFDKAWDKLAASGRL
jgi:hypothetical protein